MSWEREIIVFKLKNSSVHLVEVTFKGKWKISKSDAKLQDSKKNSCWNFGFWRRNRAPLLLFSYKQKLGKCQFRDSINPSSVEGGYTSHFSTSWHGMNVTLPPGIPLEKWSWLVMSLAWSRDFFWKWFLVCKLDITHITKGMKSSIVSFYQGLSLVQVSNSYHTWKLRLPKVSVQSPLYTRKLTRNINIVLFSKIFSPSPWAYFWVGL